MVRTVSCFGVLLSVLIVVATVLPSHASTLESTRHALGERYALSRIDIQNPRFEGYIASRGVVLLLQADGVAAKKLRVNPGQHQVAALPRSRLCGGRHRPGRSPRGCAGGFHAPQGNASGRARSQGGEGSRPTVHAHAGPGPACGRSGWLRLHRVRLPRGSGASGTRGYRGPPGPDRPRAPSRGRGVINCRLPDCRRPRERDGPTPGTGPASPRRLPSSDIGAAGRPARRGPRAAAGNGRGWEPRGCIRARGPVRGGGPDHGPGHPRNRGASKRERIGTRVWRPDVLRRQGADRRSSGADGLRDPGGPRRRRRA